MSIADVVFAGATMAAAYFGNPWLVRYLRRRNGATIHGEANAEEAILQAWDLIREGILEQSRHLGNKQREMGICALAKELPMLSANDVQLVCRTQGARNLIAYRGDLTGKRDEFQQLVHDTADLVQKLRMPQAYIPKRRRK